MTSWGKRKSDNQSYIKKTKKNLTRVIGTAKSKAGKVKFAQPSFSRYPNNINWDEALKKYNNYLQKTSKTNFTFDPQSNQGYDFSSVKDTIKFFKSVNPNSKSPVYVVSITNQVGSTPTRELHSMFIFAQQNGFKPLIGSWLDRETGFRYLDITVPVFNTIDASVRHFARTYAQKTIVKIFKNGDIETIRV